MRNYFLGIIFSGFSMVFCQTLWAEEPSNLVTEGQPNFVYGQFELLDNYPGCSEKHQMAYRVPFTAQDIGYIVVDSTLNPRAIVENGTMVTFSKTCFTGVMRGTERIQLEIPCREDEGGNFFYELINDLDISVSVQGSTTFCLSPLDLLLTESEWKVTVTNSDGEFSYKGHDHNIAIPQNEPLLSKGNDHSAIRFQHLQSWYWSQIFENPRLDLFRVSDPTEFNMLSAELACIPAFSQHHKLEPLYIFSELFVAIVNGEHKTCFSENCPRINSLNGLNGVSYTLSKERNENLMCPLKLDK